MKAIFFDAMAGKLPELVDVPEIDGRLDFAWMEKKIGYGCGQDEISKGRGAARSKGGVMMSNEKKFAEIKDNVEETRQRALQLYVDMNAKLDTFTPGKLCGKQALDMACKMEALLQADGFLLKALQALEVAGNV